MALQPMTKLPGLFPYTPIFPHEYYQKLYTTIPAKAIYLVHLCKGNIGEYPSFTFVKERFEA